MSKVDVNELVSLEFEAGMLVEQREEGVICSLTLGLASVIGAIF